MQTHIPAESAKMRIVTGVGGTIVPRPHDKHKVRVCSPTLLCLSSSDLF